MTTSTLTHRPTPWIATAVAVAAIAAGSVAMAVSHDSGSPAAPGHQSQTSVQQQHSRPHHFPPTTSGGHVMIGE